ncbi:hypothetical protein CDO87_08360 [Sagittula sp. P11]|uniref:hypothetical protein n=1 Tax=Sagittula sp. P11 TaxID=2009329 RepID=UPI000C2D02B3|nr:hypothetical protein [Sagittula sp. P11]AUC53208.1 hypothetical protein CDO87_08360 [Sagittula sp. P11]
MDRLAYFIAHMAGASIAGAALIVFFIFGWYSWWAVVTAGIIGLVLAWPVGKLISVRIKKDDPNWNYAGGMGIVPDPKAPEL